MRSRGDPAQLQPKSHTGTLQVFPGFFFFLYFSKWGAPTYIYPGETGSNGTRPLSAGHGFLEGHRRLRRPSIVIGADARLLGHLNYL